LFAASELVRHWVRPRIVERRLAPHHETRGTTLQPAVLDVIDRAGLNEPFISAGIHIEHSEILGPGMRRITSADFGGLGCRYEFQCSQPQWQTEQILRDHLAESGIKIKFGVEVVAIEADPKTLRVTLTSGEQTEVVKPRYLLGAGGAHSITTSHRRHLWRSICGRRRQAWPRRAAARIVDGASGFVLFAPLPEDRWLIYVSRDEADQSEDLPAEAELGAMVNARVGAQVGLNDMRWVSYFKMHRREAESLGDGRRFLLGDAGHMSSALGGEGINAAFMDAADIAWKLAPVVRGEARSSLLASYAVERGMADRHALEVSNDIHTRVASLVATCAEGGAPNLPPSTAEEIIAAARRRSMLDIPYAGSPLVSETGGGSGRPAPGERFPASLRLRGESHHLITFGPVTGLERIRARWNGLAAIRDGKADGFDAAEAGAPAAARSS
jgi:NADPH-dependent dioxygenase